MSDYHVVRDTTLALHAALTAGLTSTGEPSLNGPVSMEPPDQAPDAAVASLWLYQLERNAEVLNRQPTLTVAGERMPAPLPINLHYLVTPLAGVAEADQLVIAKALQVFHDIALAVNSLRITLQPLPLGELTKVWDALRQPYRLSVAYVVQFVDIDATRIPVPVERVEMVLGHLETAD